MHDAKQENIISSYKCVTHDEKTAENPEIVVIKPIMFVSASEINVTKATKKTI